MAHLIFFFPCWNSFEAGKAKHIQVTSVSAGLRPVATSQISITAAMQQSLPRGKSEMKSFTRVFIPARGSSRHCSRTWSLVPVWFWVCVNSSYCRLCFAAWLIDWPIRNASREPWTSGNLKSIICHLVDRQEKWVTAKSWGMFTGRASHYLYGPDMHKELHCDFFKVIHFGLSCCTWSQTCHCVS